MKIENVRKKKKMKFRISFIILFIFASFALCFYYYMTKEEFVVTTDLINVDDFSNANDDATETDIINSTEKLAVNPVPLSEKVDTAYLNSCYFVGTKKLNAFVDNQLLPQKNVYTNSDFSIYSINEPSLDLYSKIVAGKYKNVYLFFDVNNVSDDYTNLFAQFEKFHASLLETLPEINIYFVSALPISASQENSSVSNTHINNLNKAVLEYANLHKIAYLDINTELLGADGKILSSKIDETMNFTVETLSEMQEYILTHILSKKE